MKVLVIAGFSLAAALTASAPAMAALDIPDLFRMTGCTKDRQTAQTHIGIFNSAKGHDETREILNRNFRNATKLFAAAEIESPAYDAAVMKAVAAAVAELGAGAHATSSTFYSGTKKGCNLSAEPLAPGQNHP